MSDVAISTTLLTGSAIAGGSYEVLQRPSGGGLSGDDLLGDEPLTGKLDSDGSASVTLPDSGDDDWYELRVKAKDGHPKGIWGLVVDGNGTAAAAHQRFLDDPTRGGQGRVRLIPGPAGANGWTARLANVARGADVVQRVMSWFGGSGTVPDAGQYIGPQGYVANAADATNIKGAAGPEGRYHVYVWQVAADGAVVAAPADTAYTADTESWAVPADWLAAPADPGDGMTLWESFALVVPKLGDQQLDWSAPYPAGEGVTAHGVDQQARTAAHNAQETADEAHRVATAADLTATQAQADATEAHRLATEADDAAGAAGRNAAAVAGQLNQHEGDQNAHGLAPLRDRVAALEAEEGGEGGGLTAAAVAALDDIGGNVHSDDNLVLQKGDNLFRGSLARIVAFLKSTAALGPRLNPPPTPDTVGYFPAVEGDGDRYTLVPSPVPPYGTDQAGDALFVDGDGDGVHWGRIIHPDGGITQVGTLPEATSDAPRVVFLTHDYTSGEKDDATLTVGFDGAAAGYRFPIAGQPALGHINKESPLTAISGIVTRYHDNGQPEEYRLDAIYSFNEAWLGSLDRWSFGPLIYELGEMFTEGHEHVRRILNAPPFLVAADPETQPVNARLAASATWYWTDGAGSDETSQGLYERLPTNDDATEWEWDKLEPHGIIRSARPGPPEGKPTRRGQFHVDTTTGDTYVSVGDYAYHQDPSTGVSAQLDHPAYIVDGAPDVNELAAAGNGAISWNFNEPTNLFFQWASDLPSSLTTDNTWTEIWEFRAEVEELTAALTDATRRLRDHSEWLGWFAHEEDAYARLALITSQAEFTAALADPDGTRYYWGHADYSNPDPIPSTTGIQLIAEWTRGTVIRSDDFVWHGPLAYLADIAPRPIQLAAGMATLSTGFADIEINGEHVMLPETGDLEIYVEMLAGDRLGNIADLHIPEGRIPIIALAETWANNQFGAALGFGIGANRSVGIGRSDTRRLRMACQNAGMAGDCYIRLIHYP